jgi:hypothetical protein
MGVHPFGDPDIVDEFAAETVPIDACEFHVYAAEWTPNPVALRPFVGWPFAVGDRMWPLTRLVGTSTSPHRISPATAVLAQAAGCDERWRIPDPGSSIAQGTGRSRRELNIVLADSSLLSILPGMYPHRGLS